jgi:hypothetical protein
MTAMRRIVVEAVVMTGVQVYMLQAESDGSFAKAKKMAMTR